MLWKSRTRNIYVLVLWVRVGFWQEVSEYGGYDGSIVSVTFSWGKFNTGLVADNQMELLVSIYPFIAKATQGHIFQSVPNWALYRGQKEKDSAVKYTGQDRTGVQRGESIYRSHRLSSLIPLKSPAMSVEVAMCFWAQVDSTASSQKDNTVLYQLLFLHKPS